jgi:hypothetical protein
MHQFIRTQWPRIKSFDRVLIGDATGRGDAGSPGSDGTTVRTEPHPTGELRLRQGNRRYVFLRFDFAFQAG